MAKRGRPSLFKPEYVEQAKTLCEFGATDQELADFLKTGTTTLYRWASAHPEFRDALKAGKATADERVERSLYHKAIGYSFDAVKIFPPKGEDGPVIVPYREHVPPDTTACIFWLKNRRQQQWRDVHKHEVGRPGEFDNLSADDLRAHVQRETEALGIGATPAPPTNGTGKPH